MTGVTDKGVVYLSYHKKERIKQILRNSGTLFDIAISKTLAGMLLGRLFVGTGIGLGPPVAALYVTEVSPAFVKGTYGSLIQIATCLGIMGALLVGIPVKDIAGWWRVCFWVSTIPATILALAMIFCAESPSWLYKHGKATEAEVEFEKLFGVAHDRAGQERGINMLFVLGGNGTHAGANVIHKEKALYCHIDDRATRIILLDMFNYFYLIAAFVPFHLHGPHGVLRHLKYLIETKGSAVVCVAEGAGQLTNSCSNIAFHILEKA
ncbi:plastidic glucose transporter 4-like [Humulus lupulus]|uniref:plastidic glucose transporter 4-like n=1 Tax=Humulus lupulus TaxID=3486 RepID=UPI002B40C038|nr:plastidic glucose transporter 4-like [Humulus lupulus]